MASADQMKWPRWLVYLIKYDIKVDLMLWGLDSGKLTIDHEKKIKNR